MTRRSSAVALSVLMLLGCSRFKKDSGDGGEGSGGLLSMLDKPFEGKIDMQFLDKKSGKPATPFTYEVKQPKMRFDLPASIGADTPMIGKSVWTLFDVPGKKLYAVLDDPKKAVVFDFNTIGDDIGKAKPGGHHPAPSSGPSDPPPKFEKTGKMDTVAGYECEIWKITEDKPKEKKKEEVELCMAKKIGFFDLRTLGIGTLDPKVAVLMATTDLNHFPLRAIMSENGAETGRMEVTKVTEAKLEDSRFAVPAGYQVVTMDQMIQGFMPPGMGSGHPGMPPMPHPPPHH